MMNVVLTVLKGGRVNGAPTAYTIDEMVYVLKTAGTKFVISTLSGMEKATKAAKLMGI